MGRRQNVTLHEETIALIKEYQEQHHIRYPGEALDRMIEEWEAQKCEGQLSRISHEFDGSTFSRRVF